jgi:ribA/ribD-fused uncharacterized protein
MEVTAKYQERVYKYAEACVFRKTKELFGGLSNMASGFPIKINGKHILTSEALYQACRFPHLPDVQQKIINEKSPMTAKMVSKPFRSNSRPDWDNVRTDIMFWCLKVKLAQNFITFGQLLETTFDKPIVEDSSKDAFWGAVQDKKNTNELKGVNALGRLLMKLRQEYNSANRFHLLFVEPLRFPNFSIFDEQIQVVDERQSFIDNLYKHWRTTPSYLSSTKPDNDIPQKSRTYLNGNSLNERSSIVAEPAIKIETTKLTKTKQKAKKSKANQPELDLT